MQRCTSQRKLVNGNLKNKIKHNHVIEGRTPMNKKCMHNLVPSLKKIDFFVVRRDSNSKG
jgi:hypothetical protein